jgi:hypothetical protein
MQFRWLKTEAADTSLQARAAKYIFFILLVAGTDPGSFMGGGQIKKISEVFFFFWHGVMNSYFFLFFSSFSNHLLINHFFPPTPIRLSST